MNIILFDNMPSDSAVSYESENQREIFEHLTKVLKVTPGQSIRMGVVNQSEGTAVITSVTDGRVSFEYTAQAKPVLHPVTLLVAQVRPICMKRILREAVSLGVERIILTGSDTGEKSYLSSNLYKTGEYKWYLMEGAMQSGHAGMPRVLFTKTVSEAIALCPGDTLTSLVLPDNVCGAVPLREAQLNRKAVFAVGPERGWSDRERKLFIDSGYMPVLLGDRILRTETACSAGLGILLSAMHLI